MRIIGIVIAIITLYVISPTALSDELVHKFKNICVPCLKDTYVSTILLNLYRLIYS